MARPRKTPTCGHADRRSYSSGLCRECYRSSGLERAYNREYGRIRRNSGVMGLTKEQALVSVNVLKGLGRYRKSPSRIPVEFHSDGPNKFTWADSLASLAIMVVPFGKRAVA